MVTICPTVLAEEPHAFREQMERIAPFARRIQIDLTDGDFAPSRTVDLEHVWWPNTAQADIHLMYQRPTKYLAQLVRLRPHLVIVHGEADLQAADFAAELHRHNIQAGLALLKETTVNSVQDILRHFDHVLIFSGTLGFFGGAADLALLDKVKQIKKHHPNIEIGWDGGVNADNAKALADGGVDVLNVGGFIQKAEDPARAYAKLEDIVRQAHHE